jgi:hypothetical protein
MSAFRGAEARGLDLDHALPALVQGRSISSADDVAALLHGRVTKWIGSADGRRQPDSIVGIGPAAVRVTDPDIEQALRRRRTLIEQRARSLTLNALQMGDPWTLGVGRPPADPARREQWLRALDTVAAYRERWQVRGLAVLGTEPRTHEQQAHREAAQLASIEAVRIHKHRDRDQAHTPFGSEVETPTSLPIDLQI